jgi:recombination protein RecT
MSEEKGLVVRPVERLKAMINVDSVKEQFQRSMKENCDLFTASLIELYTNDTSLQECEPKLIIAEALKAATMRLPLSKQLGQAWIIPYKKNNVPIPQFQIGYKGWIQIALRSQQYRRLHATPVYEGQTVDINYNNGDIVIAGKPINKAEIGYFCMFELINGFTHSLYMSKDDMTRFAEKYSPAFTGKYKEKSKWFTDYSSMALKTVVKQNLSHWGYVSIEMAAAMAYDDEHDHETPIIKQEAEQVQVKQELPKRKKRDEEPKLIEATASVEGQEDDPYKD